MKRNMTKKFRKKPIVIEAFKWDESMGEVGGVVLYDPNPSGHDEPFYAVKTLEGPLHVSDGDWIITGLKGERYPCKPDIFEATYEEVSNP